MKKFSPLALSSSFLTPISLFITIQPDIILLNYMLCDRYIPQNF
ncbi:hypothetical protein [Okeania sp. SIO2C9]|nr:hypothetical protein [Okeania sp. SIO2C9]